MINDRFGGEADRQVRLRVITLRRYCRVDDTCCQVPPP
ncbi:MAG: hypothetical protein ACJAUL_003086 [Paraglaciecola sp.]|jgi:hypothetical protein